MLPTFCEGHNFSQADPHFWLDRPKIMRVEATKFLFSTTKFLVGATKFWISDTKFLDSTTKFGNADEKFGSPNQKFRSAIQKFCCLKPHTFLTGLTKNEGQPDQNFSLTQPNCNLVVPTLTKGCKRLQNFYECGFVNY